MKKKIFIVAILIAVAISTLSISFVKAANDPLKPCESDIFGRIDGNIGCPEEDAANPLDTTVGTILGYAFTAIGALSIIFILYGSVTLALSGGDPEKVKNARRTITYAIAGLILAILAQIIVNLVINTTQDIMKPPTSINIESLTSFDVLV